MGAGTGYHMQLLQHLDEAGAAILSVHDDPVCEGRQELAGRVWDTLL